MMAKKTMVEEEGRKTEGDQGEEGGGDGGSGVRTAETMLRVVPMGLCLAALVLMLKNAQVNDFGSVSYADLTPFRYLVYANGFCAGYSLLSASCTALPRPNTLSRSWLLFFFDQVFTYVILAAGTVSAELMYLAYNGDEAVTWSKECGVFDSFCQRATASIGITFGAVACYALLSLLSSYRLFSTYEAPLPFVGKTGLEIAAFPR
ncbi:CASP-like protein 2A1 [Elaeis guineensis]|uniref:CASP-like protein n=1 Tax=Elaeis guineensis var. tenera TaxID=51953 RepID=A0A6I9QYA8_ELAGV|nr:CASP-like protein 2A1 [Elaeis guineensis]